MSRLDSNWSYGGQPGYLQPQPNTYGGVPWTSSGISGPVFDKQTGRQLRNYMPEEGWMDFFGKPKGRIEKPASDDLEYELYDLPAAYTGKNSYLSQILINQITNDDTWILREFAPWIKFESSMTVSWDVWSFNDHMLGRTPEEAVSRLLNSKFTSESTTLVRYGIALMLEHGFFNTEKGRQNYAMNIRQIQNAIVETASFGAMYSAYNAEIWTDDNELYRLNTNRTDNALDAYFYEEHEDWAIVQKSEDGFENLVSKMKTNLESRNGVRPNLVCLPNGVKKYQNSRTVGQPFAMTGLRPGEKVDLVGKAMSSEGGGISYRESRSFRMGEHRPAEDPAYQPRTIGTFFQVDWNPIRGVDPKDFHIDMLSTMIYNENSDGFEMFGYYENVRYTGLFNNFGHVEFAPQSPLGKYYFAGFNSWWDYLSATSPYARDYIIKGILSKSDDVQTKFIHATLGHENQQQQQQQHAPRFNGGSQATGLNNISNPFNFFQGGNQPFQGARASVPHHRKQQQQIESTVTAAQLAEEVHRNGRFQLSPVEFEQLNHLFTRLEYIDLTNFTDPCCGLLAKASKCLQRSSFPSENVYLHLLSDLAEEFLYSDLNRSLRSVLNNNHGDVIPTALEEAIKDQAIFPRTHTSVCNEAENHCPIWRVSSVTASGSRVPISVYENVGRPSKKLDYHSEIFTLSSANIVLISLPAIWFKDLQKKQGVIEVDYHSVEKSSRLHADELTRAGLLQYSVAISAVYDSFKRHVDRFDAIRGTDATSVENRKQLFASAIEEVRSVIGTVHPFTQVPEDYQEQVAKAQSLPVLNSQFTFTAIIQLIKTLVNAVLQGSADEEVFAEAILSFSRHYHSLLNTDNASLHVEIEDDQALTGARLLTSFTKKTKDILAVSQSNDADTYDEAVRETDKLHKELEDKKSAASTSKFNEYDSFLAFRDSYIQLYQVFKARKFQLATWRAIVEKLHTGYRSAKGSSQIGYSVQAALTEIFARAADATDSVEPNLEDNRIKQAIKDATAQAETRFATLKSQFSSRLQHHRAVHYTDADSVDNLLDRVRSDRKERYLNAKAGTLLQDLSLSDVDNLVLAAAVSGTSALTQANLSGGAMDIREIALIEFLCLAKDSHVAVTEELSRNQLPFAQGARHRFAQAPETIYKLVKSKWGFTPALEAETASKSVLSPQDLAQTRLTERRVVELLSTVGNINGEFIEFCCKNNVLPPIGFRCIRPHMNYLMGSAFMAQGGGACANTLFGHADFQLADDAARKIHYGHFTMYNKTVIWSRQHLIVIRNVFCKDYLGGNGTRVWDPLDPLDVDNYHQNELTRDMFVLPIPISCHTNSRHMDITGQYHPSLSPSKELNEETNLFRMDIFVRHWGWNQHQRDPTVKFFWADVSPRMNTICFQAHQGVWNQASKNWDNIITEKGHWGQNVYPSCGKTRKGGMGRKTFFHCDYSRLGNTVQLIKN
jgi:hypothetical protein